VLGSALRKAACGRFRNCIYPFKAAGQHIAGEDMTEDITVSATEDGAVLLTIIESENRVKVRLPLEAAQKLHAQIQAALIIASVRARALEG
jgi:hypothetical protein